MDEIGKAWVFTLFLRSSFLNLICLSRCPSTGTPVCALLGIKTLGECVVRSPEGLCLFWFMWHACLKWPLLADTARQVLRPATDVITWLKVTMYLAILRKSLRGLEDHVGLSWSGNPCWFRLCHPLFLVNMPFVFGCLLVSPAAALPNLSMGCCILLAWTISLGLPGYCVGSAPTLQCWTHLGTANIMFHRQVNGLGRTILENCC